MNDDLADCKSKASAKTYAEFLEDAHQQLDARTAAVNDTELQDLHEQAEGVFTPLAVGDAHNGELRCVVFVVLLATSDAIPVPRCPSSCRVHGNRPPRPSRMLTHRSA
jgi:hypothetical protein